MKFKKLVALFLVFVMALSLVACGAKTEEPAPAPEAPKGPTQEELLAEIRDLLKEKK